MAAADFPYVHGFDARESDRLRAQADSVRELLHTGTAFRDGEVVLEIGCATGAQTQLLAHTSPGARIVGLDRSARSLAAARSGALGAGLTNVEFIETDVLTMPFAPASFDHAFGAFVLEHLERPLDALIAIRRVLRPGGSLTLFEGDHDSTLLHPPSRAASAVIACQAELQRRTGGDALIGRRLHQLLSAAGFSDVQAWPRPLYVDDNRPETRARVAKSFISMIEGVRDQAIAAGLMDRPSFDEGLAGLRRAIVDRGGTFCYTFFKAVGRNEPG